jgi:hypothetical protein
VIFDPLEVDEDTGNIRIQIDKYTVFHRTTSSASSTGNQCWNLIVLYSGVYCMGRIWFFHNLKDTSEVSFDPFFQFEI